jgi:hypothetical protein
MELVVFVNSPVAGQIGTNNFRQVVTQAYLDSLTNTTTNRSIEGSAEHVSLERAFTSKSQI